MRFRQATNSDFDTIMSLIDDGRKALFRLGIDQWQSNQPNAHMIQEDIDAKRAMVAEEDGVVVGCLAFCNGGDPNYKVTREGPWLLDQTNDLQPQKPYATLHRIAVAASAARKGIASFMIKNSFDLAKELGLSSVRAFTHEGNIPMQRAFEKCGMTHCCDVDIVTDEPTNKRFAYEILITKQD